MKVTRRESIPGYSDFDNLPIGAAFTPSSAGYIYIRIQTWDNKSDPKWNAVSFSTGTLFRFDGSVQVLPQPDAEVVY